mgnify:CR=1 FL=1
MDRLDESVDKNPNERVILSLVEEIYHTPLTEKDRRTAIEVKSYEEFRVLDVSELRSAVHYLLAEEDRYTVLKYLWWRFDEHVENYSKWYFPLYIEVHEQLLLKNIANDIPSKLEILFDKEPKVAKAFGGIPRLGYAFHQYNLLRTVAFLHQYFLEQLPVEKRIAQSPDFDSDASRDNVTFALSIGWAVSEGFIDEQTARLMHFVREVRNKAAHNMWLDRNYSIEVLEHASDCAEFLLDGMLVRETERHTGEEIEFEDRLDELEEHIELNLFWSYNNEVNTWEPNENVTDRRL